MKIFIIPLIGEKNITVSNYGKEKLRISAVLCVLADGSKLPPLFIFRGINNGRKEEELKKNKYVLKGDILVKCQPNEWTDHYIFFIGLTIFGFLLIFIKVFHSLLILDKATTKLFFRK